MFGKLELSDLGEIKAYLDNREAETVYLKKFVETFERGEAQGNFYGEMHEGALRGIFYFSTKKVLAFHFSHPDVLGSMGILKAIKLHKPQYIKGPLEQVEQLYKMLCRVVQSAKITESKLMFYEGSNGLHLKETPFDLVDAMDASPSGDQFMQGMLQELKFFIEVEQHFGRPVKAVNDILKDFKNMLKSRNYAIYLHGGRIVAQGLIEEEGDSMAIIGGIYVSEKYRNRGLGMNLTSVLTKRVADRKKKAALFVVSNNQVAIGLYEKIGYKCVGAYGILTVTY